MADSGPLTQAEGLALLQRTTDANWLTDFMGTPDGVAIVNSKLAVAEAASEAVLAQAAACMIATAPTGRPGVSSLTIARPSAATTATVPKGFLFVDSRGIQLAVALDVPVASGQTTILLPLQTLRQIDLANNTDNAFDDVLGAGDALGAIIDPASQPVLDSASTPLLAISTGVATYASSTPIVDAEMDWLSAHGDERGCRRQPGEDGEAYRVRVRQIPDAVTPDAVQGAVLGAEGILPTVYLAEPYADQSSIDARAAINLIFSDSVFADDGFCDDPLGVDVPGKKPFRTCTMPGLREGRAYFRLAVGGQLKEPDGLVLYADDGFCDDPKWGYPDIPMHPALVAPLRAVQAEANVKRAGGVQFDLYVENSTILCQAAQVVAPPIGSVAILLVPPLGKAWLIREGLVSVMGMTAPGDGFVVSLTLSDGTSRNTGWLNNRDGLPLRTFELEKIGYYHQPVVAILVQVGSISSATLAAVATFWTTLMTL
jgi:hypothetical protein